MNEWAQRLPWRTGRKLGRTIYAIVGEEPSDNDLLLGMMDRTDIAEAIVEAHNAPLRAEPPADALKAATAEVRYILLEEWSMDHLAVDDGNDEEFARRILLAAGVGQ